jgi:hypothetical protein
MVGHAFSAVAGAAAVLVLTEGAITLSGEGFAAAKYCL